MKKIIIMLLTVSLMFGFTSCTDPNKVDYPIEINGIKLTSTPKKIVSLSPTITEIFLELGHVSLLSGITSDYNYPNGLSEIESVGNTGNPSIEKIINIKPDLVISNNELSLTDMNLLSEKKIPILILPMSKNLQEMQNMYINIATVCVGKVKAPDVASSKFSEISNGLKEISEKIPNIKKSFLYINSTDGLTSTGDTFESEILSIIGTNIAKDGSKYKFQIENTNPDIILVPSNITKEDLNKKYPYKELEAVRSDKVYQINNVILEKQTTRLIHVVNEIAAIMYPEIFSK